MAQLALLGFVPSPNDHTKSITLFTSGISVMNNVISQSQEEEADEYARSRLREHSNINPQRLAQAFLRMKSLTKGEAPVEFLSTHPSLESRIEETLKYDVDKDFKEKPISMHWDKLVLSLENSYYRPILKFRMSD